MSTRKDSQKHSSHILSLLGTILILSLAARTGPGREFLSYAREMVEEMPLVMEFVESTQSVLHHWLPYDSDSSAPLSENTENEETGSPIDSQPASEGDAVVPDTAVSDTDAADPEPVPPDNQIEDTAPPPREAGSIQMVDVEKGFPLNASPYFPQSIRLDGETLILQGIPDTENYRYIMLHVAGLNGAEVYKETSHRTADGSVSFFLWSVKETGRFKISMYSNSERSGEYASFLEVHAEKTQDSWKFSRSPVYEANVRFAQDEGSSAEALAYYLRPSRHIQSDDTEIRETAERIVSSFTEPYEKTLAIHDWVSDSIFYDYDEFHGLAKGDSSALGTLHARRSVCEGYANLTCALLRAAGIPAKVVSGYALGVSGGTEFPSSILAGTGESNHAWNEAFINGRWIILDTTWDSGNKYEHRKITERLGCKSHRYFDISREFLAQNHAVTDSNNYREITLYYGVEQMETSRGWIPLIESGLTPKEVRGHIVAPLEPVITEMGGSYQWDRRPGYYDRLECDVNGHNIQLWPTQSGLLVDNFYGEKAKELSFDVVPEVSKGYTMVQIDTVLTAIDCTVEWNEAKGGVVIGYTT